MKTLKNQNRIIAILLAFVVSSCSESEAINNEKHTDVDTPKIVLVKVMKINKETIDRTIDYTSNLKAFEEI